MAATYKITDKKKHELLGELCEWLMLELNKFSTEKQRIWKKSLYYGHVAVDIVVKTDDFMSVKKLVFIEDNELGIKLYLYGLGYVDMTKTGDYVKEADKVAFRKSVLASIEQDYDSAAVAREHKRAKVFAGIKKIEGNDFGSIHPARNLQI